MPRISVLMPVYNGQPYIAEAVVSVMGQDLDDWELVISDNGSSDGTREYLATLSDPRVRVFLQKDNLGAYGNLNFLLRQARATVAKILCADDELLPHCLSEVREVTERLSVPVIKCLKVGDLEEHGEWGHYRLQSRLPDYLEPRQSLLAFLTFGNFMDSLSCAILRPAVLLSLGGFDRHLFYAGDYEGWIRFSRIQGFNIYRRELVRIRRHDMQGSFQLNRRNESLDQYSEVLRRCAPLLEEEHKKIVIEHWTRDIYPRFWPQTIKVMVAGHVRVAWAPWLRLPLGIRWWQTLPHYFPWRRRNRRGEASQIEQTLFDLITSSNRSDGVG